MADVGGSDLISFEILLILAFVDLKTASFFEKMLVSFSTAALFSLVTFVQDVLKLLK